MIKSFRDKRTEELFTSGWARGVPPDLAWRAIKKLTAINEATSVQTLRYPAGNRLHALAGDRNGQYSVAVNRQWRICFYFADGHAYDVELCDYH
jgi:proteic killer suppression protein